MNPITEAEADEVRATLLRDVAPASPGARIGYLAGRRVLLVVATGDVRCQIDGRPVAEVARELCLSAGSTPIRYRIGCVLVAALYAVDGMLVRSGDQHYVIADSGLAKIDQQAHRYLLRHRMTDAAAASSADRTPLIRSLAHGPGVNPARWPS